ncbi:hypothetical protein HPB52_002553 [Rhipicephalus sanguineus]|uniref:Uncharacterized protein n=1 Tax=Rhipicephalus sanguineus TaxID=34632 RepID=A0A9D4Q4H2_RHISA|nr:hypothetical protein HPB52_002553 [Rhipicephalus sanguineus]
MAACTEVDWHSEADRDIVEEPALRNSSLECDIDVSVTVTRSSYTAAAKHSGPLVDMPSEKSGLSLEYLCSDTHPASEDSLLDGDPDKDFPPGDGALIPGFSDVSLPPKHTITADPLDLSLSEGDDTLGQQSPVSKPLAVIPEEPELEAQLEMEHPPERNPEELSTHMEEEPAPLMLDALPIQDHELSIEAGNDLVPDSPEPSLKISEQSLVESAVLPEISDSSLKEDKATSTAEVIVIEDLLPVRPKSPYQMRNTPHVSAHTQPSPALMPEKLAPPPAESRPVPPTLSQRDQLGARRKVAPVSIQSARSVGAEVAPPVVAKGFLANQFLEKIGQMRGGVTVLSEGGHDTCTLNKDLMSIEGAQKQPDKYKKEEFGELFTKGPVVAAQFAPKLKAQSRTETAAESDDEDSMVDFDHLPIRSRMDIWKRREARAIRKGL